MKKGYLITFEGTEGAGKTTQIQLAKEFLERKGYEVVIYREPGGTEIGEKIREILKHGPLRSPETEVLLFQAARAEYVTTLIKPALNQGRIVLSDRYTDSSLAYQGYGLGLNLKIIKAGNEIATQKITPSLTFFLDVPVKEGLKSSVEKDNIEARGPSFMEKVRLGYLELAKKEPSRIKVIPRDTPEKVHKFISQHLENFLKTK